MRLYVLCPVSILLQDELSMFVLFYHLHSQSLLNLLDWNMYDSHLTCLSLGQPHMPQNAVRPYKILSHVFKAVTWLIMRKRNHPNIGNQTPKCLNSM